MQWSLAVMAITRDGCKTGHPSDRPDFTAFLNESLQVLSKSMVTKQTYGSLWHGFVKTQK